MALGEISLELKELRERLNELNDSPEAAEKAFEIIKKARLQAKEIVELLDPGKILGWDNLKYHLEVSLERVKSRIANATSLELAKGDHEVSP